MKELKNDINKLQCGERLGFIGDPTIVYEVVENNKQSLWLAIRTSQTFDSFITVKKKDLFANYKLACSFGDLILVQELVEVA
jgi:hypothetical protein|tara:strand:- start:399 stop:644 length:246 start_codon:yes stop_codon:yes gene_type:complete